MTKPAALRDTAHTRPWHALEVHAALTALASNEDVGLSGVEAQARLVRYGHNLLQTRRGPGFLSLLGRQVNNPIVYLLLGSAVLAVALGKLLDGLVVFGAVVVNTVIGFLQEYRAVKDIESLSRMVPDKAKVIRDGRTKSVQACDLVPGDIILLASGDKVPADVRLVVSKNLQIEEAALTGESVPSQKAVAPLPVETSIGDQRSMAFGSTLVTNGWARALVVATGEATELGRISHLLAQVTELRTPLTRALASVGKWLMVVVLCIAGVLLGISLLRGYSFADALLVAITLAVASIPEGITAVITIVMAIGVQRMAALHAIVRNLPSVETLGSASVICSDKTGTLTRNEMTVQALYTPADTYTLSGVGYSPVGKLSSPSGHVLQPPADVQALFEAGALCSDASIDQKGGGWHLSGDPSEGALVVAAMKVGMDVDALRRAWPRLDVVPFESEHQFMATLHSSPGEDGRVVFIKGAPEVVLRRCGPSADAYEAVMSQVALMASQGMRVLAAGRKRVSSSAISLDPAYLEKDFTLLGLQGMMDPPRPEVIEAVKVCHAAGITVKMITGDHLGTAEAISQQLGLCNSGGKSMTGAQLAQLDALELRKAAIATNVFARVAPEHKLRLVQALQDEGQVVAMTGDGINDAPALKKADIGIAMGITGSAVAKEAADVVLADDNFASIAAAVEEGRRIYDNLVKSLAFVLPTHLGLGLVLIASVAFFPVLSIAGEVVPLLPMLPTQILWINLVAAVTLSLPLAFEIREPDAMRRPPRTLKKPILDRFLIVRTILVALLMAIGAVGLFLWEYWTEVPQHGHTMALREAQTMAVTTVVFFQIIYLGNCRSLRASAFQVGFFSNRAMFAGVGGLLLLQAGFIYLPFMQRIFGTASLEPKAVGLAALVATIVVPLIEIEKAIRRRTKHHPDFAVVPADECLTERLLP